MAGAVKRGSFGEVGWVGRGGGVTFVRDTLHEGVRLMLELGVT